MCGIAGEVRFDADVDRERVFAMTAGLSHRGPDAESTFFDENRRAAFGFRRLAIVDLVSGDQPIRNEDGTVVSMLNGEIYNHVALRRELSSLGHTFATDHADSEVIPHGYEAWGVAVLEHLRGMFAIALWDRPRRRLLLARDRLGEKPLYYRRVGQGLRFSSELQQLVDEGDEVDDEALALYLTYQYIPAPSTILREIKKLEPGEVVEFDETGVARRRYWSIADAALKATRTTADDVTALIEEAVVQRCEADVPIGAFLSGGVDSSVTTALLARSADRQVHTFSFGFAESRLDETEAARQVASRLGTDHHVVRADALDPATIERAVGSLGEPLADAASIPTYLLSEVASQHVKVVLTGEGADELFGGYARYLYQHRMRRLLSAPLPIRRLGASSLRRAARFDRRMPARLADLLDSPRQLHPREWRAVMPRDLRVSLLPGLAAPGFDPVLQAAQASAGVDDMAGSFATDLATWVPDDLLVKVDRTTMAHGLEARPPFLDHVLVEAVLGLPAEVRWTPGRDKPILRDFAATILSAETANRRKQTFTTPTDAWLRGPLQASNAEATAALLDWGINAVALRDLQRRSLGGNRDRGQWAWVMYVLGRWLIANPSISSRLAA
jgi:asparagine synthase (glutamine-hydrolysing)